MTKEGIALSLGYATDDVTNMQTPETLTDPGHPKNDERYHKMIDEVEDYAILMLDRDGIIQNWNRGAEKIKGYKEEEIIGKSFKIFYLPEDQQNKVPELLIKTATEQGKATHEGWRVRKDGSVFWGSIVITAIHDDKDGSVIGFTKVTRDLTERKKLEDQLKRYARRLEVQNNELEQFVYIASHDMKEPLRKIIMYNSMVEQVLEGTDVGEKIRVYLDKSVNAASRMEQLINDLLAYSKTSLDEDGFEDVDLNHVLKDALDAYEERLADVNGKVSVGRLPVICAIPFQMRQLFDNLVSNAIKYRHPDRQLQITVKCEEVENTGAMRLAKTPGGRFYKISVADNGIGFNEAYCEKIFEVFQRLVSRNAYAGTGIGLSICKKIAQRHGGFIRAVGKEGEGACFDIYLPAGV